MGGLSGACAGPLSSSPPARLHLLNTLGFRTKLEKDIRPLRFRESSR